MDMADKIRTNI